MGPQIPMFLSGPQLLAQIEACLTQRLGQELSPGVLLIPVEKLRAELLVNSEASGSITMSVHKKGLPEIHSKGDGPSFSRGSSSPH